MLNPRRVLTRSQILDHVWEYDFGGDARVLETYISYLRKKLDATGPSLIHTARGVGYALRPPRAEPCRCARASSRRSSSFAAAACSCWARHLRFPARVPGPAPRRSDALRARGRVGRALRPEARAWKATAGVGRPPRRPRRRPPAEASLPPGTYGERRDADGTASADRSSSCRQGARAPATCPTIEAGDVLTVGARATGTCGTASASAAPGGQGVTVVALPRSGSSRRWTGCCSSRAWSSRACWRCWRRSRWVLVRVGLRPLEQMADTAGAIAGGDLSRRVEPATPRTEVGRLGLALNAMLARLEGAFREREASEGRLRRFLADASHELRTPLASIRGYAELYRIGAAREPAGVEKAMRRIEDEAARMGVLVEDLLTLARLDEVRGRGQVVDLAALAATPPPTPARWRPTARSRRGPRAPTTPSCSATPTACARCWPTSCATRSCTPPPGRRSRSGRPPRRAGRLEVRDHGPGCPRATPTRCSAASGAPRAAASCGRGGAGLGPSPRSWPPTAARAAARRRGGGAAFTVALPPAP